jgi:hypothetical protein
MKNVACPECGRFMRPSNLDRHRRARHLPRARKRAYGHKFSTPAIPITVGADTDRRYDEHIPRGEGDHRYRIYRLRAGELELVSSAPDAANMGIALVTNHAEGEFEVDDSPGVLDTLVDPGHWVVNPWALGRRKP